MRRTRTWRSDDLRALVGEFKAVVREVTGRDFPTDPSEQLDLADQGRLRLVVRQARPRLPDSQKIAHDLGTAVNVVTMVFGNMGDDSGTGVAFTRDPNTGETRALRRVPRPTPRARTSWPASGRRRRDRPHGGRDARGRTPSSSGSASSLESHYRDVQDLEFTIERGKLYMLQTRSAKRTAAAAVKIAVDMVEEGIITKAEAVGRIEPAQVDQLLRDQFDPRARVERRAGSSRGSTRRRARRSAGRSSTPTTPWPGSRAARR